MREETLCGSGPGLQLEEVTVTYPGARRGDAPTTAVDGVSLTVAPGEVVALLGPSGCGKSSLLRAVAGLEPIAAGRVFWAGADVAGVPVHRRGFGLMFQDGQLFAHQNVAGNVEYGLRIRALPAAQRRARVAELLDIVGLHGSQERSVATMSGGERQRVALARALAPEPQLLLLDEPLSALDRALRERLATDLRAVLLATGTTALFVTHDHDEAFTVADRVAVMSHGRLLQVDTPARLWDAPASRAVAEFLGYQEFLPDGGGTVIAVGPDGFVLADGPATFTGTVVSVAFRRGGVECVVDLEIDGVLTRCAVRGGRAADARRPAVGEVVGVEVDVTRIARVPSSA